MLAPDANNMLLLVIGVGQECALASFVETVTCANRSLLIVIADR